MPHGCSRVAFSLKASCKWGNILSNCWTTLPARFTQMAVFSNVHLHEQDQHCFWKEREPTRRRRDHSPESTRNGLDSPPHTHTCPTWKQSLGNVHRHLLSKQIMVQCWKNPQNGRIYGKEEDKYKQVTFHLLTTSGTARNTDPASSIKLHKSRQVSSAIWVASSPS